MRQHTSLAQPVHGLSADAETFRDLRGGEQSLRATTKSVEVILAA